MPVRTPSVRRTLSGVLSKWWFPSDRERLRSNGDILILLRYGAPSSQSRGVGLSSRSDARFYNPNRVQVTVRHIGKPLRDRPRQRHRLTPCGRTVPKSATSIPSPDLSFSFRARIAALPLINL